VFYDLALDAMLCLSSIVLLVGYTSHPYSMWERTVQGHKYQGVGIIGEHLEPGYHNHLSYKMVKILKLFDPLWQIQ